ncbi:uncharacterized protein LOC127528731 [Erpetoichthys calabaricus]|uniref:uncharacterized protein LOC127528731 n=1 Tax=Erpetoichthys calabaricus TaxID=27687 RepID=UPI00223400DD|nr:uncharacterized protein LOC127528731 [Erpetoichthys calabaricus]XP_051785404.1 uncharacterized protein LOC127528731 [Erpetoichthys calabaricus]
MFQASQSPCTEEIESSSHVSGSDSQRDKRENQETPGNTKNKMTITVNLQDVFTETNRRLPLERKIVLKDNKKKTNEESQVHRSYKRNTRNDAYNYVKNGRTQIGNTTVSKVKIIDSLGVKKSEGLELTDGNDTKVVLMVVKPYGVRILHYSSLPLENVSMKFLNQHKKTKQHNLNCQEKPRNNKMATPSRCDPTDCRLENSQNKSLQEWLKQKNVEMRKQRAAKRRVKKKEKEEKQRKAEEKQDRLKISEEQVKVWLERKRQEVFEYNNKGHNAKNGKSSNLAIDGNKNVLLLQSHRNTLTLPDSAVLAEVIETPSAKDCLPLRSMMIVEGKPSSEDVTDACVLKTTTSPIEKSLFQQDNKNDQDQQCTGKPAVLSASTVKMTHPADSRFLGSSQKQRRKKECNQRKPGSLSSVNPHVSAVGANEIVSLTSQKKESIDASLTSNRKATPKPKTSMTLSGNKDKCYMRSDKNDETLKNEQPGTSKKSIPQKEPVIKSILPGSEVQNNANLGHDIKTEPQKEKLTHSQWLQRKEEDRKRRENQKKKEIFVDQDLQKIVPKLARTRIEAMFERKKRVDTGIDFARSRETEIIKGPAKNTPRWLSKAQLSLALEQRFLHILSQEAFSAVYVNAEEEHIASPSQIDTDPQKNLETTSVRNVEAERRELTALKFAERPEPQGSEEVNELTHY